MTTYTAEERAGIAAAFRAAKPFLWGGSGDEPIYDDCGSRFICIAVNLAKAPYASQAEAEVMRRIGGMATLTVRRWLFRHGIDSSLLTPENMQAYRHRWLDALIAEFEAPHPSDKPGDAA